jgi:hypothetical protein
MATKKKPTDDADDAGFAPAPGFGPHAGDEPDEVQAADETAPAATDGEAPQKRTEEARALAAAGPAVAPLFAEGKQPPHGTARRAADLPAPRVCHPLERAGGGLARFKLRGEGPAGTSPLKYVLAADEAEAEAFYRAKFKLADAVSVVLTELPD